MCPPASDAFSVRLMTHDDISFGMRLKTAAGWNQTEADWRRFIDDSPGGVFVAEWEGVPVATLCNIVSDGIGWIGMVLVDESHRRKGIATRLMRHAIAEMDRTGIPTARLDATPMGKSLYERLGFSVDYDLVRYEGKPSPHGVLDDAVRPAEESDYEEILALDARVKNINRRRVLTRFFHECPDHLWVYREGPQTSGSPISGSPISGYPISGYIAAREGTRAWQIGPCMALHPDAGQALLATVFRHFRDATIFVDVLAENQSAVDYVRAAGLEQQRPLTRMSRGPAPAEDRTKIWCSWGPEKG